MISVAGPGFSPLPPSATWVNVAWRAELTLHPRCLHVQSRRRVRRDWTSISEMLQCEHCLSATLNSMWCSALSSFIIFPVSCVSNAFKKSEGCCSLVDFEDTLPRI